MFFVPKVLLIFTPLVVDELIRETHKEDVNTILQANIFHWRRENPLSAETVMSAGTIWAETSNVSDERNTAECLQVVTTM